MNNDTLEWTGERLTTGIGGEIVIEHLHRYALAMPLARGRTVLDIACGEGYGSYLLASVSQNAIGVDISSAAVEFARRKYSLPNLRFLEGSATQIPLPDGSVDLVVSFETLEHLREHERMLDEIKRVLRPTGVLFMSSPDKKHYSDETGKINSFHVRELYREEFISLMRSKFAFTRFLGQSMVYGSLILPDGHQRSGFKEFRGDFDGVSVFEGMVAPMYNLCLASDSELEDASTPHPSVFNAQAVLERLRATGAEICASRTYRAGLLVTLPLRLLRQVFRRQSAQTVRWQ